MDEVRDGRTTSTVVGRKSQERERETDRHREREIPCDGEMEDGRWRARELEWLGVRGLKERPVDLLGG